VHPGPLAIEWGESVGRTDEGHFQQGFQTGLILIANWNYASQSTKFLSGAR